MPALRGLTVCVGDFYARTLEITLIRNARHFVEIWVVTTPDDEAVRAVVENVPNARLFTTDAFTRPDANGVRPRFNKGLSVEECLSCMGRHGWLGIIDADILLPDSLPLDSLRTGFLYGAKRRTLEDVARWSPDFDWRHAIPEADGNAPVGFAQFFHAESPNLVDRRPWYDVSFPHAGGGDAHFMSLFHRTQWKLLPGVEVLHLGPRDCHWFGVDEESKRMMASFVRRNGWKRAADRHNGRPDYEGEIVERVEVPGYEPSSFELPFVQRHRQAQQRPH